MSDEIPICHSAESKSLSPSNRHHLAIYLVLYLRYFGQTLAPRFVRMTRLFELQSPVKGLLIFTLLLTGSQPSIPPTYTYLCTLQQRSKVILHVIACAADQSCCQVSPLLRTPYYDRGTRRRGRRRRAWRQLGTGDTGVAEIRSVPGIEYQ